MLWILALSLLCAATLGSVLAYQRGMTERLLPSSKPRRALPEPETKVEERTLQTLRPGDVIIDGSEDWLIISSATYREEDETWWVHLLEDGPRQRLLEVRARDALTVAMLEPADDVPTFGQLGQGLTFRQQSFQLWRRGDARIDVAGAPHFSQGVIRYASYAGPGGALLNIEESERGRLGFVGEEIPATGLMLMPGEAPEEDALADLETL